jgi:hypothetical protein
MTMTPNDLADALARRLVNDDAKAHAAMRAARDRSEAADRVRQAILAVVERAVADERERCALVADRRASRLAVRTESDPGTTAPSVSKRQAVAATVTELRSAAQEMRAGPG